MCNFHSSQITTKECALFLIAMEILQNHNAMVSIQSYVSEGQVKYS